MEMDVSDNENITLQAPQKVGKGTAENICLECSVCC